MQHPTEDAECNVRILLGFWQKEEGEEEAQAEEEGVESEKKAEERVEKEESCKLIVGTERQNKLSLQSPWSNRCSQIAAVVSKLNAVSEPQAHLWGVQPGAFCSFCPKH